MKIFEDMSLIGIVSGEKLMDLDGTEASAIRNHSIDLAGKTRRHRIGDGDLDEVIDSGRRRRAAGRNRPPHFPGSAARDVVEAWDRVQVTLGRAEDYAACFAYSSFAFGGGVQCE